MSDETPELAFERLLLTLEGELLDSADEEIFEAARELGMNPRMKGSSAFFGVITPTPRPLAPGDTEGWSDGESPCQRSKDDFQQ